MYIARHKAADSKNIVVKCKKLCVVGFEVLTAVIMKCSAFWDITPCSPVSARFSACSLLATVKMEAMFL
jgi:hypothetical protein